MLNKKYLITYCYFESENSKTNLKYFLEKGIIKSDEVFYIFVIKGLLSIDIPKYENIRIIKTENKGYDFGGYIDSLNSINIKDYDFFIFLNDTVRGPFIPLYFDKPWYKYFTSKLSNEILLSGSTINFHKQKHIQSCSFCLNKIGIELLYEKNFFDKEKLLKYEPKNNISNKYKIVDVYEKGMSKIILDNNYKIKSLLLSEYKGLENQDIQYNLEYYEDTLNPFETIFIKTNRINNNTIKNYTFFLSDIECKDHIFYENYYIGIIRKIIRRIRIHYLFINIMKKNIIENIIEIMIELLRKIKRYLKLFINLTFSIFYTIKILFSAEENYKYNLSLVAIFKNEKIIMKEWLNHYINEGVEHFYLIDNGSDDNYLPILKPYIDKGIVELFIDKKRHSQPDHYNKYAKIKETKWLMVCDFDEFIYARNGFKRIPDYLESLEKRVGLILIPWKMFGSNNIIEQPKSVINNFNKRGNYNNTIRLEGMHNEYGGLGKYIIRTRCSIKLGVHEPKFFNNFYYKIISSDNSFDYENFPGSIKINEDILSNSCLHLNHYVLQSLEWFKKVKCTRGSANSIGADKVRTLNYFNSYNKGTNEILDNELANKKYD